MVQTANKLNNYFFDNFCVSIFDEAHHIGADQTYSIAMRTKSPYVFGLSATPYREDGADMKLRAGTGDTFINHTLSSMIKDGYLAKPKIKVYDAPLIPKATNTPFNMSYTRAYTEQIVQNRDRNYMISKIVKKHKDKSVYIHVKRKIHGKNIEALIPESIYISGTTKLDVRTKVLNDFKNKKVKVLISTLLGEGVDLPCMDVLVLACGGKSRIFVTQLIGRVLRITAEKKNVEIIDFRDDVRYLRSHYQDRENLYCQEPEFDIRGLYHGQA